MKYLLLSWKTNYIWNGKEVGATSPKELPFFHVKMATNICKINKKLHFIENLTKDFEKTLDPPVDLLDAPLDSPLYGEFL